MRVVFHAAVLGVTMATTVGRYLPKMQYGAIDNKLALLGRKALAGKAASTPEADSDHYKI